MAMNREGMEPAQLAVAPLSADMDGKHEASLVKLDWTNRNGISDTFWGEFQRALEGELRELLTQPDEVTDQRISERAVDFVQTREHEGTVRAETVESMTSGAIGGQIALVPGAGGRLVAATGTYATTAKIEFGVPEKVIVAHGEVSNETARHMALAALRHPGTNLALGIVGVAGPGRQNEWNPGTVRMVVASNIGEYRETVLEMNLPEPKQFSYDPLQKRDYYSRLATWAALYLMRAHLDEAKMEIKAENLEPGQLIASPLRVVEAE